MSHPLSAQSNNDLQMRLKAQRQLPHAKDVLEKIRLLCLQRGAAGILGLGRMFRRMDRNNSGSLSREECTKGLNEIGLHEHLTPDELRQLFDTFDSSHCGYINFDDFLRHIRPPLNEGRTAVIEQAFRKMDKAGKGVLTYDEMKNTYNVESDPEFQNGSETEKDILLRFLKIFDGGKIKEPEILPRCLRIAHHPLVAMAPYWKNAEVLKHIEPKLALTSGLWFTNEDDSTVSGIHGSSWTEVTWDEFLDYYSGVSASIDEDVYFNLMMRQAWKL